ncbi:MAG: gluconate 2-dehydrogenase subunit 3 family protein [Halobacteriales archaeon]|nr:gluconate 2-dehydrogenase subunit 3 family protein [Halobacteriales archaeon]
MELTRRDVAAALAAAGIAIGGGGAVLASLDRDPPAVAEESSRPLSEETLSTLVAAAGVLYPSEVANIEEFVTGYLLGRAQDSESYASGIADAAGYLDAYAESWYDESFAELDRQTRTEMLENMGADSAAPDPAGSDVERVRYYVVNELLFALYTSPTGGRLVGLENPQGHPGGLGSYQRGPPS